MCRWWWTIPSRRGQLSPNSISVDFGWKELLLPATIDSHFWEHIQNSLINFIVIINRGLFSTILLGGKLTFRFYIWYSSISINAIAWFEVGLLMMVCYPKRSAILIFFPTWKKWCFPISKSRSNHFPHMACVTAGGLYIRVPEDICR